MVPVHCDASEFTAHLLNLTRLAQSHQDYVRHARRGVIRRPCAGTGHKQLCILEKPLCDARPVMTAKSKHRAQRCARCHAMHKDKPRCVVLASSCRAFGRSCHGCGPSGVSQQRLGPNVKHMDSSGLSGIKSCLVTNVANYSRLHGAFSSPTLLCGPSKVPSSLVTSPSGHLPSLTHTSSTRCPAWRQV
jgi:hypothetical protein